MTGIFFKIPVEGSFGIKTTIEGDRQHGILLTLIPGDIFYKSIDPLLIDQVIKCFLLAGIDDLG